MHQCLGEGCTRSITDRFALCNQCEEKYGRSSLGWPGWLRFLWNDMQREQRRNRLIHRKEISIPHDG